MQSLLSILRTAHEMFSEWFGLAIGILVIALVWIAYLVMAEEKFSQLYDAVCSDNEDWYDEDWRGL